MEPRVLGTNPNPVRFASVELRDGQQSLLATRMRTEDMLPIMTKMDEAGYDSIEMWGGATFDSCIRFLNEDPWDRIRAIKSLVKKTPLRMFLRGQNLVGYVQYPDDVVEHFIAAAAKAGIDIFLTFDGLNDTRNCETVFRAVKKAGKKVEANIIYTKSPVHTIQKYVDIAKKYEEMGAEAIHIEDTAGIMDPVSAGELISAIKAEVSVPVHLQCHCTGGMADLAYWEAARAGVDVLDVDVASMALGTSHPAAESMLESLKSTTRAPRMNQSVLAEINAHFARIRPKYEEYLSKFTGVNIGVLRHQIPGGMLSNLENQLKQMNMADRLDEVLAEAAEVRKDLGYPPLATPFSQIVGVQATMNVMMKSRYKMMPKETMNYIRGLYGKVPGTISDELIAKIPKTKPFVSCRPGDLLDPGYEKAKREIGTLAHSEEDVITYALFGETAREYLTRKYAAR
jgi:pyruvate/oxaloacetate carboxyltransferase